MRTRRMVLRPGVGREQVEELMADVGASRLRESTSDSSNGIVLEELLDVVHTAMLDRGDVVMRTAGVWATIYSRWPEFIPPLDQVAQADPVDELRYEAAALASVIRTEAG